MPDGWDWFYTDSSLTSEAPAWQQVSAGEDDAELWINNRAPGSAAGEEDAPSEDAPIDASDGG